MFCMSGTIIARASREIQTGAVIIVQCDPLLNRTHECRVPRIFILYNRTQVQPSLTCDWRWRLGLEKESFLILLFYCDKLPPDLNFRRLSRALLNSSCVSWHFYTLLCRMLTYIQPSLRVAKPVFIATASVLSLIKFVAGLVGA